MVNHKVLSVLSPSLWSEITAHFQMLRSRRNQWNPEKVTLRIRTPAKFQLLQWQMNQSIRAVILRRFKCSSPTIITMLGIAFGQVLQTTSGRNLSCIRRLILPQITTRRQLAPMDTPRPSTSSSKLLNQGLASVTVPPRHSTTVPAIADSRNRW